MINTDIKQLENLTLGQIAEMTNQAKIINNMKFFKLNVEKNENKDFFAQEVLDEIDTRIRRPKF